MRRDREDRLKALGGAIFERRTTLGLRQADIAEHCGFDRTVVSYIEHGLRNPTIDTLACIADALGCKVSDLLRDAGM